jgi:excinuclease ABC subunit C
MVQALQRDLHMSHPPLRIECFDNSHIQGTDLVSSMVVFENGKPKKSDYRKFKNETVLTNDDFASMKEVVSRRYTRVLAENIPLPDLIVIDGGKGQLSGAVEVLKELGIEHNVRIIGLAKRLEEIFLPGHSDSILLPKASSSLRLIQQIRDEAHRFAITFHRKLRDKRTLQTQLTEIEGIGDKKAEKLLKHFGSVKKIKEATQEQIAELLNSKDAEKIITYFSEV